MASFLGFLPSLALFPLSLLTFFSSLLSSIPSFVLFFLHFTLATILLFSPPSFLLIFFRSFSISSLSSNPPLFISPLPFFLPWLLSFHHWLLSFFPPHLLSFLGIPPYFLISYPSSLLPFWLPSFYLPNRYTMSLRKCSRVWCIYFNTTQGISSIQW